MPYQANPAKILVKIPSSQMNELVNNMNTFFKKISKGHIQFQLSDHYQLPKKDMNKNKVIKKESKSKMQVTP